MALPGYSIGGPTLEIFQYQQKPSQHPLQQEDIGFISTGFESRDVASLIVKFSQAGGSILSVGADYRPALLTDADENIIQIMAAKK